MSEHKSCENYGRLPKLQAKLKKITVMEMQFSEDEMGDLLQALQTVASRGYPNDSDAQIASQILEVHSDACRDYEKGER